MRKRPVSQPAPARPRSRRPAIAALRPVVLVAALAGLAAVAGLAGCDDRGRAAPAPDATRIDVGARPYLSNAPLYIAAEEGFFADEGLDVRLRGVPRTSTAYLTTVENGDLDVLATPPSFGLFNLVARGGRLRMVAGKGHLPPGQCSPVAIVARRDAFSDDQIGHATALRGRIIDVDLAHAGGFYAAMLLRDAGLSLADIDPRNLPAPARLEAMDAGALDAVVTAEPWLTRLYDRGHRLFAPANAVIPDFQWGVLVFSRRLLEEDRDAGRRFLASYLRGVRQYGQGRTPRNLEILERRTGLDRATLERVCWPPVRPGGVIDTTGLRAFQEWALDRGMIDRLVPADEYLDLSLLPKAQRSSTVIR
jgi:NitT/TauT family transport system substrate-binding protein